MFVLGFYETKLRLSTLTGQGWKGVCLTLLVFVITAEELSSSPIRNIPPSPGPGGARSTPMSQHPSGPFTSVYPSEFLRPWRKRFSNFKMTSSNKTLFPRRTLLAVLQKPNLAVYSPRAFHFTSAGEGSRPCDLLLWNLSRLWDNPAAVFSRVSARTKRIDEVSACSFSELRLRSR